jgi:DNA-binding protein H-NS
MARTLTQIQSQIAKLQREAEAIKAREMVGVIERIRDAVGHYGLTVEHIFGVRSAKAAPGTTKRAGATSASRSRPVTGRKAPVKYKDDQGNTWSGRGSRPRWLRFAIEDGASLADFEVASK